MPELFAMVTAHLGPGQHTLGTGTQLQSEKLESKDKGIGALSVNTSKTPCNREHISMCCRILV